MVTKTIKKPTSDAKFQMDYEEFLSWSNENTHAEWVEGEVTVYMPSRNEHQVIAGFLLALISEFVNLFDLGQISMAPFEVKLWTDGPSREPDLFFLKKEHLDRLSSERLVGPPDLIIEIISPSSVYRDRDEKYREYAQAGVPEYWIIDSRPGRHRADFYRLTHAGHYQLAATEDDEKVESAVLPGFWLNPNWLWLDELPSVITLLYNMSPEAAAAVQSRLSANE
ncbi:MAG: Uma2 family endonuclease [Chloroflexi bacterium]|nr:Uma2 family endonuclease [Chloroflexota bacterium]